MSTIRLARIATILATSAVLAGVFAMSPPAGGGTATAVEPGAGALSDSWGPFARQCSETRVSHFLPRARLSPSQATETRRQCIGFSAMPSSNGTMAVTASVGEGTASSPPVILRFLRGPNGVSRAAGPGDLQLLAQGSDDPGAAERLARDIGVSAQQLTNPAQPTMLPVRLALPWAQDVMLSCRPDGGGRDGGRKTILLRCDAEQPVRNAQFRGKLSLAGVEEVDARSGIRLASELSGRLDGTINAGDDHWRVADYHIEYSRSTDFE